MVCMYMCVCVRTCVCVYVYACVYITLLLSIHLSMDTGIASTFLAIMNAAAVERECASICLSFCSQLFGLYT